MRNRLVLLAALVLAAVAVAVPCGAQGAGRSCDLSGSWYGGSDPAYPYLASFTPVGAGRYYSSFQNGYDARLFGYSSATAWVGETIQKGSKTFDSYIMSYWILEGASLPEVDIVHSRITFIDCNTFTSTIDVFSAYFSFTPDKTPFVTAPDFSYLSGGPIVETYHRIPTTLRHMGATSPRPQPAVAAPGAGAGPASKSTASPTAAPGESKSRR